MLRSNMDAPQVTNHDRIVTACAAAAHAAVAEMVSGMPSIIQWPDWTDDVVRKDAHYLVDKILTRRTASIAELTRRTPFAVMVGTDREPMTMFYDVVHAVASALKAPEPRLWAVTYRQNGAVTDSTRIVAAMTEYGAWRWFAANYRSNVASVRLAEPSDGTPHLYDKLQ